MKKIYLLIAGVFLLFLVGEFTITQKLSNTNKEVVISNKKPENTQIEYKEIFKKVYSEYPDLPNGILESISYVTTRLEHRKPTEEGKYSGLMGLMSNSEQNSNININYLSERYNISKEKIINDPYTNVKVAGMWINEKLNTTHNKKNKILLIKSILKEFSGIQDLDYRTSFLREDFAYQVISLMEKGIIINGLIYLKPNENIETNSNFDQQFLEIYNKRVIDLSYNRHQNSQYLSDYPEALWVGSNCSNSRNGTQITDVTIHDLEGYWQYEVYTGMQNCDRGKSVHYVIRSDDGLIAQLVNESDKAWHIGNANPYSIGIEHEGFANNPIWYTDSMYTSSADLVRDIASSGYGINSRNCYTGPANQNGTLDILNNCVAIKAHAHYPLTINTNSHYDPGENWDWFFYYGLINNDPNITTYNSIAGQFYDSGEDSGNYSNLEYQVYRINPGYSNVSLSIEDFNLSYDDYIWIFDKPNPTILSNGNGDLPIISYQNGNLNDLNQTTFTSNEGGFYIIFRSNCGNVSNGYKFSWVTNNFSCNNNYEPNNNQSQAFLLSSVGKDFSNYGNLEACLSYNNIFEDWYLIGATAQGKLSIILTDQTDDFKMELYSEGANSSFDQGVIQSNGDVTLEWCPPGNSCTPLYIRVFQEQNHTPSTNPNYNYNLILDWDYNVSCNSSGRIVENNSVQNNLTITGDNNICAGESTNLTANGGSGNYQWFLNGSEIHIGNSITLSNLNVGNNTINVVDLDSACNSGSTTINVTQGVTANAGNNVSILSGESTTLQGFGSVSCSWSPTTGLNNPNSCNPTASPTQTTTYTLTVSENGCTDTDIVTVTVEGANNGNPPQNDDCSNAITLTSSYTCNYTSGSVEGATPSFGANNCLGCSCTSPDDYDVYYKFTAVETSHTVTVSNYASNLDAVIELRTACSSGSSNYISCFDPTGAPTSVSETWTGLTIGQTYYIRVFEWGYQQSPPNSDAFDICVTHQNSNTNGIDLISDITSVSNDNPDAGDTIIINYTGSNIGDVPTTILPTISFFLSTNTTLSGGDDFLNSEAILQTIAVNETVTGDIQVTLPNVSDGQYYLVSSIDNLELIDESNEDNNISFYVIQIGDVVPNGPNLDVRRATAVPDIGLVPGQEIELEIRIENDGNEDSNGFDILVYLDIDDDGNPDSNEVMGEFAFSPLDADEDITIFEDFNLPANIPSEGSYDLYVLADSNNDINETNENDNDKRDNVTIVLVNNDAENDVVVLNQTVSNTNVNAGQNVDVTVDHVYLGNNTTGDLPSISLGYYLSTDCNLSIDDILLEDETSNIGINNPVQDEDHILTIPIGTQTGTYYILFVADNEYDIDEDNFEDNNVECIEITVANNTTPVGDITVIDGYCLPENIASNNEAYLLTNIGYSGGRIDANSYKVYYYFSTDCVLSDDDIYLDDDNASLSSDTTISTETSALILPTNLQVGTYYILILADAENELYETNEDNNIGCIEFNIVSTDTNYQDVTLSNPYVESAEADIGDAVPISIYQNYTGYQTEDEIGGIAVHYYLSADCELSSDDHYFNDDNSVIGNDDSTNKETYTMIIPDDISPGQYYVLFIADATNVVTENNEDNNIECVPIAINETLSVDDNELVNKIKVYPNPVSDILTINLGEIHSKINLEIFNVLGQKVNTFKFDNNQVFTININDLSNGIYFFKINTDTIKSVSFKVIKE